MTDTEKKFKIQNPSFGPLLGTRNIEDAKKLFYLGVEKLVINREFHNNPDLVTEISEIFGIQSVSVSIDYKKNLFGKNIVYIEI